MSDRTSAQFSSERPIVSRSEDLLNRVEFAEQIARAIRQWTGRDSLVIALYGDWGAGKSSLKNLIVECLRSDPPRCPCVVEFNPWQWAGQSQLAEAFFREIGLALNCKDESKASSDNARRWLRYAAILRLGTQTFAAVRQLALIALAVLAAIGFLGAFFQTLLVKMALLIVSALSLIGIALMKSSDNIARAVADYFAKTAETQERGLDETKRDLSVQLRKLERPMLVIVDDIDRLTAPEMLLCFQLVKANADFPNMVYLVLFQRSAVEDAISAELKTSGPDYLKKIVQVGFDIPSLQQPRIEQVLAAKLDTLLQSETVSKLWDRNRWANVFIPGLRPYFQTLRDVYRFISSLSLHFAVFSDENTFECNPIDLISLEVLRVFEPDVYRALPGMKDALTTVSDFRLQPSPANSEQKSELLELLNRTPENRKEQVKEILKRVFPPCAWMLGGTRFGFEHYDEWYREHRACHVNLFEKYFSMTIAEGDVSVKQIEELLSLAPDREALLRKLESYRDSKLLEIVLERLEPYKETINLDHFVPFASALFEMGDAPFLDRSGISMISPDMHVIRIVMWSLKRQPDIKVRGELLRKSIEASSGIFFPVSVVALEGAKAEEQRGMEARLADDTMLAELKLLCAKRIQAWAGNDRLLVHARFADLLGTWSAWGDSNEVSRWVKCVTGSDRGLLSFIVGFVKEARSYGAEAYYYHSRSYLDIDRMDKFLPFEEVAARLSRMTDQELNDEEKRAVDAFTEAAQRKREGKAPISPMDM